jgi:hypothetical protein
MIREFPLNRGFNLRYERTADERINNTIVLARVTAQSHPVDLLHSCGLPQKTSPTNESKLPKGITTLSASPVVFDFFPEKSTNLFIILKNIQENSKVTKLQNGL